MFHCIEHKQAIIRNIKTGVFKQVRLYERDNELYVGTAGGFVRLMAEGRTSHPTTKWDVVEATYSMPTKVNGGLSYNEPRAVQ